MQVPVTTKHRRHPSPHLCDPYNQTLLSLSPGNRLGPYEIVSPLGAGGMGEVYRAHDQRLGRDVAIKVMTTGVVDADRQARFEQEARATAALNHPNIVSVYDVGQHEASVTVVNGELKVGTPQRLFHLPTPSQPGHSYVPTADGSKFLVIVDTTPAPPPVTLMLNWRSLLTAKK